MATLLFVCLFAWITNAEPSLPPLQVHPLPQTLQTISQSSDHYFEKIELSPVGHLIWSEFPIRVYVEPIDQDATPGEVTRQTQWDTAVKTAITEWGFYLPMTEIETRESADIIILRSQPARPITLDPETGLYQIPRAQTAETRYEFYVSQEKTPKLRHRMTIQIKPGQGELSALSSARHELGHALGIWGHSSDQNDALYFSQTGQTPRISERDIQTLRRIYGESTRLGWPIP